MPVQGRKNIGTKREERDVKRLAAITPGPSVADPRNTNPPPVPPRRLVPYIDGATDPARPPNAERVTRGLQGQMITSGLPGMPRGQKVPHPNLARHELKISRRVANLTARGKAFKVITVYRIRQGVLTPMSKIRKERDLPKEVTNPSPKEDKGDISPDKSRPLEQTTKTGETAKPEVAKSGLLDGINPLVLIAIVAGFFLISATKGR